MKEKEECIKLQKEERMRKKVVEEREKAERRSKREAKRLEKECRKKTTKRVGKTKEGDCICPECGGKYNVSCDLTWVQCESGIINLAQILIWMI